jgi:hypothetical protein
VKTADILNENLRVSLTVNEWSEVLKDIKNPEIAQKLESCIRLHVNSKVDRFRDLLLAEVLGDDSEDETQDIERPAIEHIALDEEPQELKISPGLQWHDTCAVGAVCALFLTFVRVSLL